MFMAVKIIYKISRSAQNLRAAALITLKIIQMRYLLKK